jgi:hypothetical protein
MVDPESIMSIPKSGLEDASRALNTDDIPQLVEWLSSKDDDLRYQAFLLLQSRSAFSDDVYPFWDAFRNKLKSKNSYQRSIGLMLIAENVKWDTQNKIEDTIGEYLACIDDPKPITVRQCIQSLGRVASARPALNDIIASTLVSFDVMAVKETMRKLILLDILNVLLIIQQEQKTDEIESFISESLSGDILDKKSKKQIEALLTCR